MAAEHRNALPLGAEFEGYRVESILGAGGFGITYKARELSIDREVAIKEYLPKGVAMREGDSRTVSPIDSASTDDFEWGLDRFRQEAKVLVALKHPNIVPVLRFFEANNTAYMVMEYQHGMSLGQVLRRDGTLDEDEIRELLFPIMDGLAAIHEAGFLHRDIKPDNIFIREDGTPVLIDFGSARQSLSEHSRSVTAIISEGYAPYEQYQGGGERSAATDIYSLGATLYRCMTGDRPPDAPTRINSSIQGKDDPLVPSASAARGRYSKGLTDAVDRALQIVESDRPQSVAAFRTLLDGERSRTPAQDTLTPAPPVDRGTDRTETPREKQPRRGGFGRRHAIAAGLVAVFVAAGGAAALLFTGSTEDEVSGMTERDGQRDGTAAADTDSQADTDAQRRAEEEEAQRRAEEEAQRRAEEEAERRRREEEARRQAEEEAQRRAQEEAERRRQEEEARRQAEEEAERRRREEEARRQAEEEAERRRQEEEAQRRAEEEAERRRREEEARRQAEEEAERRRQEEEARRQAEEERRRQEEAEERRRAEAARERREAEAEERRRREQAEAERARQTAEAEAESEAAAAGAQADLRQYFSGVRGYMTKELSVGFGPANIQLDFGSGGRLRVSWEVASVDTLNTETVDGSWNVQGNELCMQIPRVDGGARRCYSVVDRSPTNCRLQGGGELSGTMRVTR